MRKPLPKARKKKRPDPAQARSGRISLLLMVVLTACLTWMTFMNPAVTPAPGTNPQPNQPNPPDNPAPPPQQVAVWGIDTVNVIDPPFLACVRDNYGSPDVVARYLTPTPNSSALSAEEAAFIREQSAKLLPIYNGFTNATGNEAGRQAAQEAAAAAQALGIPHGIALFADIEQNYPVDAAWIRGWVDGVTAAHYSAGIYENPVSGGFAAAYNQAVAEDATIAERTVLWSNQPSVGVTKKDSTPAYAPAKPDAANQTLAWQYGIQDGTCNIDTNLIDSSLLNKLW